MIELLFTIILSTGFATSFEGPTGPLAVDSAVAAPPAAASAQQSSSDEANSDTRLQSILVFSRTAGFRHGSIKPGQKALGVLGQKFGFHVEVTEDPARFTATELQKHQVVVFLNTTQDVLAAPQERVFEQWIRGGGGYVGIHAAADTEYQWSFYGQLVGAYFSGHPRVQPALIEVKNQQHPATAHLPKKWTRTDEWYNFKEFPEHVEVLAYLDTDSYQGSTMKGKHPAIWCHEIDQGRALYTVGGHTDQSFSEPLFLRHLHGAIWWAAGHDTTPPANSAAPANSKPKPKPQKKIDDQTTEHSTQYTSPPPKAKIQRSPPAVGATR